MNWLDKEILGLRRQDKIGAPIYYQVVQPPYGLPTPPPEPQVPDGFPRTEPLFPPVPDDPNDKKDKKDGGWKSEPGKIKIGGLPLFKITLPRREGKGGSEPSSNLYIRQQDYADPNPPTKTEPEEPNLPVPEVPARMPVEPPQPTDDPKPTPVPADPVPSKPGRR